MLAAVQDTRYKVVTPPERDSTRCHVSFHALTTPSEYVLVPLTPRSPNAYFRRCRGNSFIEKMTPDDFTVLLAKETRKQRIKSMSFQ